MRFGFFFVINCRMHMNHVVLELLGGKYLYEYQSD